LLGLDSPVFYLDAEKGPQPEAIQIVHGFEHVSPTDGDSFARICGDLVGLLNRLAAHNKKEGSLMQEAFDRDDGGEG
jgi:hypothetical protein